MEYKNFRTDNPVQDLATNKFKITVINSSKYISITADNLDDLTNRFHNTIDKYIEECEQLGINPLIN